jgi:UDP-GlcNAc:undecaprenyl-phosphate GlcNAc-1-phosphate transferase
MFTFAAAGFGAAFITSLLFTPLIRRLAPGLGLVDQPGLRKVHVTPTPIGGGIAVFLGLLVPVLLVAFAGGMIRLAPAALGELRASVGNDVALRQQTIGIVVGAVVLFAMGLADDRWNLSWRLRLGVQVLVAFGVTQSGVQATVFVAQPWIGVMITMLWIMVLTNAMNFLDNMDGLSAGIGVIASLLSVGILLVMVPQPHWAVAFGLLLLAGSLSGFLCWNRPPASIFMGDSGSNLVGFLLATLTVSAFWRFHSTIS